MDFDQLICPVCGEGLAEVDRTLNCPQGHAFDLAREGYVNLLLPGRRRPKALGDTRDMLKARRAFLDRGHYTPLSDAINAHAGRHLTDVDQSPARVVEVGCGEGYYIGHLKQHLNGAAGNGAAGHGAVAYCGVDISKEAARLASKRYRGIRFVVADAWRQVPCGNGSVHVLLNVFAPRNAAEFDRITARGGMLIVAIPAPDHLAELRASLGLLGIEPDKETHVVEQLAGAFVLVERQPLTYPLHLDREEITALIRMTPNDRHTSEDRERRLASMESARTRASFVLLAFHKQPFQEKR